MKRFKIIFYFFVLINLSLSAQSIYLDKSKVALDFGIGYIYSMPNIGGNFAYNISGSILGRLDLGFQFTSVNYNESYKEIRSYTLALHARKEPFGIAANLAYSNSELLAGLSLYKRLKFSYKSFADKIIPILSIGKVLPDKATVISFGVSFQKNINENLILAFSPGVNVSDNISQLLLHLELVINK